MMKTILSALTLVCLLGGNAQAHELDSNRATLVLRDQQHLSVTFYLDYASVLHQVLAPQKPVQEFLLMASAMKPQEFQVQLQAAQRKLQSATVLAPRQGKAAELTQWVWPEATAVQGLLQQRAMQAVVAPSDHAHTVRTEVRAEARSGKAGDFTSVTLRLPTEFKEVLLVSYQPKQVWAKPLAPLPVISF
jgi:hypothetical protein